MKGLKLFIENSAEEMSFIRHFFPSNPRENTEFDRTAVVVYADWLQEHDQEPLAVALRNAVSGNFLGKSRGSHLIHDRYMEATRKHPITFMHPNAVLSSARRQLANFIFILDGYDNSDFINPDQSLFALNRTTGVWHVFHNDTNVRTNIDDLELGDISNLDYGNFSKINISQVPDGIVEIIFFYLVFQLADKTAH